jgi:hypothetical protein
MSLYKSVRNGETEISLILTVPRTISSALVRAMAQSPDIDAMFYQAFDSQIHGTQGMQHINKKLKRVLKERGEQDTPAHLVFKEMAYDISARKLHNLAPHCKNVIILCRDPHHQVFSALKAEHQAERKKVPDIKSLPSLTLEWNAASYRHSWEDLQNSMHYISENTDANVVIVDGDLIRYDPDIYLKALCKNINIRYTSDMTQKWAPIPSEEEHAFSYYKEGYTTRIMTTSAFTPPDTPPPGLSDFPPYLHDIMRENLTDYARNMRDSRALRPSLKQSFKLAHDNIGSAANFMNSCPSTLYTLNSDQPEIQETIRQAVPQFIPSFDIIDKALHV